MTVWQAIDIDNSLVIFQTDSAKELADLLCVSPAAIYMSWYRAKACLTKKSGRNRHYFIEKVVITDD